MKFKCPNTNCGQPLEVDEAEFANITFNCPRCGQPLEFEAPDLESRHDVVASQPFPQTGRKVLRTRPKYVRREVSNQHVTRAVVPVNSSTQTSRFLFLISLSIIAAVFIMLWRQRGSDGRKPALAEVCNSIIPKNDSVPESVQPTVRAAPIISTECWFSGEANSDAGHLKVPQGKVFFWARWKLDMLAMKAEANAKYSIDSSKCTLILPDETRCSPVATLSTCDANNTLIYVATAYSIPVDSVKNIRLFKLQLLDGKPVPVSPVLQPYNMIEGKTVENRWPVDFKGTGNFEFENGKIAAKTMKYCPESANGWFITIIERFPNGQTMTSDFKKAIWNNHPFEIRDMDDNLLYSGCSNVIFNSSDMVNISTNSIKAESSPSGNGFFKKTYDDSPTSSTSDESRKYVDPKERFKCFVPEGWRIDVDKSDDPRSKVRFFKGKDEIRIISRSTGRHILDESDKREFLSTIETMLEFVRKKGGQGRSLGVTETTIDGTNGYLISLEVDRPQYMLVKQVKYKKDGWDHLVGLYIYTKSDSAKLLMVFEDFLLTFKSCTGKL